MGLLIRLTDRNDYYLLMTMLSILGFTWRSENHSNFPNPFKSRTNLERISYIGFDIFLNKIRDTSSFYVQTGLERNEKVITVEEFFNIFKFAYETYILPSLNKPYSTRIDINQKHCITTSRKYDLVFTNTSVRLHPIDIEAEPTVKLTVAHVQDTLIESLNNYARARIDGLIRVPMKVYYDLLRKVAME